MTASASLSTLEAVTLSEPPALAGGPCTKSARRQAVLEPGAVATGSPLTKDTSFLNEVFTRPGPVATASGSDTASRIDLFTCGKRRGGSFLHPVDNLQCS